MLNKNITRAHLGETLKQKFGLNREQSSHFIEILLKETSTILKEKKELKIPLFGVFFSRSKNPRIGRNPKTMEEAPISARRVGGFRPSRLMKDRVNMSLNKKK